LPERYTLTQITKLTVGECGQKIGQSRNRLLLILDNRTRKTIATVLADILPRPKAEGRLLPITRIATIAGSCTIVGQSEDQSI